MDYKAFIGIDVSKMTFDAVLIRQGEDQGSHQKFENNPKGYARFFHWINKEGMAVQEVFFCMEHTGVYALPIACELDNRGLSYCMEMALKIKKSMGISRVKNDKAMPKSLQFMQWLIIASCARTIFRQRIC